MIKDWKQEIAAAWLVKQAMMELDQKKIFPYHLPDVSASEEQLLTAEQHLGYTLDTRYKEFLRHANGWAGFWHSADLFGTDDLIAGPRNETGELMLRFLDEGVLTSSGVRREELVPISATRFDKDLFVLTNLRSASPGQVIWYAGVEIERFPSFDEYFRAMVDLSRVDVKRFREQQK